MSLWDNVPLNLGGRLSPPLKCFLLPEWDHKCLLMITELTSYLLHFCSNGQSPAPLLIPSDYPAAAPADLLLMVG